MATRRTAAVQPVAKSRPQIAEIVEAAAQRQAPLMELMDLAERCRLIAKAGAAYYNTLRDEGVPVLEADVSFEHWSESTWKVAAQPPAEDDE